MSQDQVETEQDTPLQVEVINPPQEKADPFIYDDIMHDETLPMTEEDIKEFMEG
jgi:hypothetical protein